MRKGLYLQVDPNGSKFWRLKYRFADKERKLCIGCYPEVTLAKAREHQLEGRRLLADGIDPGEQKKQTKRSAKIAAASSFEAIAREWLLKFSWRWAESHSSKVILRIENDLFPWLRSRPITAIEADEPLETLRRIEARGALDSAHRCLGYCNQIFRYAIATGRARRNPAADLRGALPPAKGGHFASITDPEGVTELLRAIDGYEGSLRTRSALRTASGAMGAFRFDGGRMATFLPADPKTIRAFIEDCIRQQKKPATIRRYVATIARAHIAAGALKSLRE